MSEYLVKVKVGAAGTYSVPIAKRIYGVYSSTPVKLAWDFNGDVSDITPTAATVWEPHAPFTPAPTSKLVITTTTAADITIRME